MSFECKHCLLTHTDGDKKVIESIFSTKAHLSYGPCECCGETTECMDNKYDYTHKPKECQDKYMMIRAKLLEKIIIPACPDEIAPEFLIKVFEQSGIFKKHRGNDTITSCSFEEVSSFGNTNSKVYKIKPVYSFKSHRYPESIIAKFSNLIDIEGRLYSPKEFWFYNKVIDGTLQLTTDIHLPECYYVHSSDKTKNSFVILEDLICHYRGAIEKGCSIEEARAVLSQLAALHALYWNKTNTEGLYWISATGTDTGLTQFNFNRAIDPFLYNHEEKLPSYLKQFLQELRTSASDVVERLNSRPTSLLHNNAYLDNIMFSKIKNRSDATLIDWNCVAKGCHALDLVQFLMTSLTPGQIKDHSFQLLHIYHKELCEKGVYDYPFEIFLYDYRLALIQILIDYVIVSANMKNPDYRGDWDENILSSNTNPYNFERVIAMLNYYRLDRFDYSKVPEPANEDEEGFGNKYADFDINNLTDSDRLKLWKEGHGIIAKKEDVEKIRMIQEERKREGEERTTGMTPQKRGCYCEYRGENCGTCQICQKPSHTRHFYGVPYTGCLCKFHMFIWLLYRFFLPVSKYGISIGAILLLIIGTASILVTVLQPYIFALPILFAGVNCLIIANEVRRQ
ncbi:MAG: DUF1679 domain-containing protein [Planctomycetes bacterium]|nr:DUF1679 domain-containing protein [Planctomycetota bacterium]